MSSKTDLEKDGPATVVEYIPETVNASGHRDQLRRQYGLLDICATALVVDSAWVVLGGSVVISIPNGGPPGLLYEFLASCVYYGILGLCIAEMASAIPSSGGVYHWASITPGPQYGRAVGFFAGHLGYWGWLFGWAALIFIPANVIIQMYAVYHPAYVQQPWQFYITFVILTWLTCTCVVFGNRLLPLAQRIGLWLVCIGCPVSIIVLVAMPRTYATNAFVWMDFANVTGWPNGVAFLTGIANIAFLTPSSGAIVIGTPDSVTHSVASSETIQYADQIAASFCYAVALMYAITDLDAVVNSPGAFPLAAIYAQATNSQAGTFGGLITTGRNLWALARDNAIPFSGTLSGVSERLECPVAATVASVFGAIALGSQVAFNDLAGSFIILTTTSFLLFILPNALTRGAYVPKGPFHLGARLGPWIHWLAVVLIAFFNIIFCFPVALPVKADLMNYNCVIVPGLVALTAAWWHFSAREHYHGPRAPWGEENPDQIMHEI
ncbi:hypothetical protein AURDEDRAFT_130653 [Auricularia subglabra TFB-10046 SS5]|uniref:Amino acid transporter n=1 Tax=Auricularia subglabra (strain TFB-10046 / SS5) TaxID=717982 RepID=J0LER1_AURST|nr:hypothetical protein AURDEDRAFT_130653 [Auricularia subglabra TFB-10046 SS5]